MEDLDFHVRAMREFGAHFMDRIALRYRIGSPSLMHSPDPDASQLQCQRAECKPNIARIGACWKFMHWCFTRERCSEFCENSGIL